MTTVDDLITGVFTDPEDDDNYLILADRLEDDGDERAGLLRTLVECRSVAHKATIKHGNYGMDYVTLSYDHVLDWCGRKGALLWSYLLAWDAFPHMASIASIRAVTFASLSWCGLSVAGFDNALFAEMARVVAGEAWRRATTRHFSDMRGVPNRIAFYAASVAALCGDDPLRTAEDFILLGDFLGWRANAVSRAIAIARAIPTWLEKTCVST
jgi:uncharacterized protein (TIGR02996 family)